MEGTSESFSKFKTFLDILFIRKKAKGYDVNDFKKEQFEYIQPHLEELLPLISIEEVHRIKIYFQNAFISHLNNGLGLANNFPQRSLTPDPVIAQDDEAEESPQLDPEIGTVDDSQQFVSQPTPQQFVSQPTPLECVYSTQTQKRGPLMQSTPLSAPMLPGEPRTLNAQQQEHGPKENVFITDIISQINISPISINSAPARMPNVQQTSTTTNEELNEVSFLKNFANIEREIHLHEQSSAQNVPRRTRKRPNVEVILRKPKKKMDKVTFEVISCTSHKTKTDKQIKRAEESFLYFALMRGKETNLINSTVIPEGEPGHVSLQRVTDLSNILRAHASQIQTSVEQPLQMSQKNLTRSPLTPQGLLPTSLPFTPLRGDISGFEPRMVIDQATSFPTHSLIRQQPLLPIPERESSIHIPLTPQVEEMYINDPENFSNLPREDRENIEMIEEQLLQIAYNDPSHNETQQAKQVPLNCSAINIPPLIENEPIDQLGVVEDQPLNVPGMISEDFEMIEQLQPPVDSLTSAQQSLAIDREMETRGGLVPGVISEDVEIEQPQPIVDSLAQEIVPRDHEIEPLEGLVTNSDIPTAIPGNLQEQPLLDLVVPMQLDQSIAQDAAAVPLVDEQSDNPQLSWFERLRARADLPEYPREVTTGRRKKRRRRRRNSEDRVVRPRLEYELPVIPRSGSHENINELAVPPIDVSDQLPQNQESVSLEQLNPPQQEVEVSNQINQSLPNLDIELPDNARFSEGTDRFSEQITQYPIQIDKQLKEYLELIKRAARQLKYVNWERFDSVLFNENDSFDLFTNIFKNLIKNNYVAMNRIATTKLEAAKGFRFILDLKTMGLIEVESVETRILGIKLISPNKKM